MAALSVVGCGARGTAVGDHEVPDAIDPKVVEATAARDGIDQAAAQVRAADTWRLAKAYLDDHGGEPLPAARREHLRRAALARAWLRDDFEARHGPSTIPAEMVEAAKLDPRLMHERLHVVCQLLVTPPMGTDGKPPKAPESEAWRARAQQVIERVEAHARTYTPHPEAERDCSWLDQLVAVEAASDDDMVIRVEGGVFEVCRDDLWDPGFVAALCEKDEPGIYGPFWTQYGAHVAVVLAVEASNRPATEAERETHVREAIVDEWRRGQYPVYIERLRGEFDVRFNAQ